MSGLCEIASGALPSLVTVVAERAPTLTLTPGPPPRGGEGRRETVIIKSSLSCLKDHLDTDEPLEKLADKLTMIGLEVENIEDKAKALAPFTIARVISAEQHA